MSGQLKAGEGKGQGSINVFELVFIHFSQIAGDSLDFTTNDKTYLFFFIKGI